VPATTTSDTTTPATSTTSRTTTTSTPPIVQNHPPVITDTSSYWRGTTFHAKVFYNDADGDATSYSYSGGNQLGRGSGSVTSSSSGVIDQAFDVACAVGAPSKALAVSFTIYDRQKNASNAVSVSVVCPSSG
jgi:hypothetical protein